MKSYQLSNYDKKIFIILSIIAISTFFYDTLYSDVAVCLKNTEDHLKYPVIIITFIHHFISVFGLFGWLFNNKILLFLYISFVIITVVQWKLTGGECLVTKSIAILSDTPEYKRFNDVYKILNIKKYIQPKLLYYGSLSIFVIIALYKLFT